MDILLADMDGVMLDSHAYRASLRHTMDQIGEALGFAPEILSPDDIQAFEGAGVTAEWDSASICAALLLDRLWHLEPQARLNSSLLDRPYPRHDLPLPDFAGFARRLGEDRTSEFRPLENASALIEASADGRPPEATATLVDILRTSRNPERSLTYRLIQERNLGSHRFTGIFGLPAVLGVESYLESLDRPMLTGREQQAFLSWGRRPQSAAVIFTNRPSLSPDGSGGLPEAEIGRALCGLDPWPMMAMGGLAWLARRRAQTDEAFLKPSPLHVLAALQLALGSTVIEALEATERLALDQEPDAGWQRLEGSRVIAMEDASKGLRSAAGALAVLRNFGVHARLKLFGIATHPAKIRALEHAGAVVVPHVRQVLPLLSMRGSTL